MPQLLDLLLSRANTPPLPARPKMFTEQVQVPPATAPTNRAIKLEDPSGRYSGSYDQHLMTDIIRAAKKFGEDPLTALAMSLQETQLGKKWPWNPMHYMPLDDEVPEEFTSVARSPDANLRLGVLDASMQRWQDNKRYAKVDPADEELAIQAYNGLGRVGPGQYGNPEPQNGRLDRPYGKRVLELREQVLRPNALVQELLNRTVR